MKRSDFLANVRRSLQSAYLPGDGLPLPLPALSAPEPAALVERFTREVELLQGRVYQPASQAAALDQVAVLLATHGQGGYLAWDAPALPLPGLLERLQADGFTRLGATVPWQEEARRAALLALSEATVGITGVLAGLADTGSLVVQSQPGQGRLVSLLPPVHIALLPVAALYPNLDHFVARHGDAARTTSNLVIISGPSRTADIEQMLTLGVHGPGELHVILV